MADRAENKQHGDVDTGPRGTRLSPHENVDRYFTQRQPESNEPAGHSGAVFIGINGVVKNQRFEIPAGRSTVGRSSTNSIVIDTDSVSLVHARILEKDGEWWVLNLLSTNGTYVNNRTVADSRLYDGDHVQFGEVEFIFHNREPIRAKGSRWLRKLRQKVRSLFGHPDNT